MNVIPRNKEIEDVLDSYRDHEIERDIGTVGSNTGKFFTGHDDYDKIDTKHYNEMGPKKRDVNNINTARTEARRGLGIHDPFTVRSSQPYSGDLEFQYMMDRPRLL
jgi:hypothetical protein